MQPTPPLPSPAAARLQQYAPQLSHIGEPAVEDPATIKLLVNSSYLPSNVLRDSLDGVKLLVQEKPHEYYTGANAPLDIERKWSAEFVSSFPGVASAKITDPDGAPRFEVTTRNLEDAATIQGLLKDEISGAPVSVSVDQIVGAA